MGSLLVLGAIGCDEAPMEQPDPIEPGDDAGIVIDPVDPNMPQLQIDSGASPLDAAMMDSALATADSGPQTETPDAAPLPTVPSEAFTSVYGVIMASCLNCHGAGKTLDLSTPALAHAGLVGASAKYAACAGDGGSPKVLVVAGSPETSLLMEKLDGVPSCGKQMPPKALLNVEDIELFRTWITDGAKF